MASSLPRWPSPITSWSPARGGSSRTTRSLTCQRDRSGLFRALRDLQKERTGQVPAPTPPGIHRGSQPARPFYPFWKSEMTPTVIPAEAADWARGHVGRQAAWALPVDLSGARAWRMSSPQGLIDLRITRNDDDFRREIYAHRNAIRHLSPSHGPRLLANEPRLRSLLTVQPRGWRVDSANLQLLLRVHEEAGRLLRVLHDSVGRHDKSCTQAARTTALYVQRIRALVRQVGAVMPTTQHDAVERSAAIVLEHVRELPAAFCHGAFGPSTWEWQSQSQTLSFTGFGRSQVMAAVVDLARPALLWAKQPNLRNWFFKGYGRALLQSEVLILGHMSVLAASEDLLHAIHLRDRESIAAAAAVLRQTVDHAEMPIGGASLAPADVQDRCS